MGQARKEGASATRLLAFGPVPSCRLGRSLGIDHISPKACTYARVYCERGRTLAMRSGRFAFYAPNAVAAAVRQKVNAAPEAGEGIDYLTLVPDGEPTLDTNVGRVIGLLRPLDIPIAVITNSSLIWRRDVQTDLLRAEWVSVKVDAAREDMWRAVHPMRREALINFLARAGSDWSLVEDLLARNWLISIRQRSLENYRDRRHRSQ